MKFHHDIACCKLFSKFGLICRNGSRDYKESPFISFQCILQKSVLQTQVDLNWSMGIVFKDPEG